MKIETIKRPWQKTSSYGTRYKRDPFYNSSQWQRTRKAFLLSEPWIKLPPIGVIQYRNTFCVDCWNEGKINDKKIEIDHVIRIEDGGSRTEFTNLLSRCNSHHCSKSAKEGNEHRRGK